MKRTSTTQDLHRQVNLYLDNELPQHEEKQLLQELQQNPLCQEVLRHEQSFRDCIRNKMARKSVSPALIQSIKEKIRVNHA